MFPALQAYPLPSEPSGKFQLSLCCWVTQLCPTLRPHGLRAALPFTNFWSLLKLMSIESVMLSNHFNFFRPLLLPSVFPSIRVFSNESVLHIRWRKYWSFSFSIGPSNEYSGLISFKINRFDLLAVQGTLKSLIQYHNSKELVLWCSAFFSSDTTVNWFKYNLPQCS